MSVEKSFEILEKIEERLRMTDDDFLAIKNNLKKQENSGDKPSTPEMIEARFREPENY